MHEAKLQQGTIVEVEMEPAMVDAAPEVVAKTSAVFGMDEAGREVTCKDTVLQS